MAEEIRNRYNVAIVLFVALGSLAFGYSVGIISTTLAQPSFISYFQLASRPNRAAIEGAMNGLYTAGGLVGALTSSLLADRLGRKRVILLASIVATIGGALQGGSVNLGMFIFVRFVSGFGVGLILVLVPMYQTEVSPPHSRGLMVGMHGAVITFGFCAGSWIGYGFYFVNANGAQWRVPLALQALPALFLSCGILFLPESPRWLISKDRDEEALGIVNKLRFDPNDPQGAFAHREYMQIKQQYLIDKRNEVSWRDMFVKPSYRKRIIIGFTVMFASQTTGTTVISNYQGLLYGALGFDASKTLLLGSCWITLAFLGNIFNALTLDRIGRVRALQIGWIGDIIALTGECVAFSKYLETGTRAAAIASVAFLFVHIFFFSFNVDATSYVYVSEIFPTHIRAKGMAISVSGYFISLLIYLEVSPTAFGAVQWKFYLYFLCAMCVFVIPTFFYFPETKGIPLEEINSLFGDEVTEINLYGDTDGKEITEINLYGDTTNGKEV